MKKIFISYSHRDTEQVQRIYDALRSEGFDVWMDHAKLIGSADWWDRICKGIEESVVVMFMTSSRSLASEVCTMEAHYALELDKRIIPIILEQPDVEEAISQLSVSDLPPHIIDELNGVSLDEIARKNWRFLSRYHWLEFIKPGEFDTQLDALVTALEYDAEYSDKHTAYLNRAISWDLRKRHSGFLLSRVEAKEMRQWLLSGVDRTQQPNDLHHAYLIASEKWLKRQRVRRTITLIGAVGVTVAVAAVGILLFRDQLFNPPPRELTGSFNVAISEFVEMVDGEEVVTEEADKVSDIVNRSLANFVSREDLVQTVDFVHEGLPPVKGAASEERERSAIEIANQVNADVVIYATISASNELQLHFYIDPLFSGGEELYGETRFGAPIPLGGLNMNTPVDEIVVEDAVLPRTSALMQFLYGVLLTKAQSVDRAVEQFQNAASVPDAWVDEDSGKEVVYLWLGTAYNEDPFTQRDCQYLSEGSSQTQYSLFCARAAYEQALTINNQFARAYIGLGNVNLHLASPDVAGIPRNCHDFDNAIANYQRALDLNPDEEYANLTLLKVKTYANIGRANTRAFFFGLCPGEWYDAALEAFENALEAIPVENDSITAEWEAANIQYWIGLAYRRAGQAEASIVKFEEAIADINPETWPQNWQELKYWATLQIGHAYQDLHTYGEGDYADNALETYHIIIDAAHSENPETRYSNMRIISEALYNAGLVTEGQAGCDAARIYYNEVLEMDKAVADIESFEKADDAC